MRSHATRVLATLAIAAGSWSAVAMSTTASAAPALAHHPRVATSTTRSLGWASSNWSGYAVTGSNFTSATAAWKVPSVTGSRHSSTFSSSWVGIDGFNNSSLIQTGTEQDFYQGSAHYNAWWEILPAAETAISMTVRPGDSMTASITRGGGGSWTITINDVSRGETFSTIQSYSGPLTSVEWIQEAPTVGGRIANLAQYSSPVTFDPGTVNGGSPGLVAADGGAMIQHGVQVSTPSNPDSGNDGFNVSYGSTAPAPPA